MNKKKEKINDNKNNSNLNEVDPIKISLPNTKNIILNDKKQKEGLQTFISPSNFQLQNEKSNLSINYINKTILNDSNPKKNIHQLNLFNNNDNLTGQNNNQVIQDYSEGHSNKNNNKKENEVNLLKSYTEKTTTFKMNLQEFYINNNIKNKELKHKNNLISTTKYNIITFIPKSLLIQFGRLSNVYFLATAIIQSIPLISPLSSVTAIFPLIFVLSVSMIRDLIEDLSRLTYDRLNNNEQVIVYRKGKFIQSISAELKIGELIIVNENKQIPCDLIVIDSSLNEGMAYVETSSLDGEKSLKPKLSNNNICGLFKNLLNSSEENPIDCDKFINMEFQGFCQCDSPNSNLHKLDGKVSISYNINNISKECKFPITEREMILKGSVLKNTNWIIGFVLYTGMNNKIILNSKRPRTKMSLIEKKLNKYLIGIFIFLIILCAISSFIHNEKYNQKKKYYERFILLPRSHNLESFITFFTYFLLLNTLIPISLIITLEIVKMIQGFFISWDAELYSKIRHKFAKAKTVSINEELGSVNYIFSDKTGTLTANKMQFKYCILYNKCYQYDKKLNISPSELIKEIYYKKKIINKDKIPLEKNKLSIIKIPKNFFSEILKINNYELDKNIEEYKIINEFWTAISIAHECVCSKKNIYSGISPDDVELVKTANEQGYSFIQSSNEIREIRVNDYIQTFTVLNVLNFSSERKRMSIIIKDSKGIIKLYSKGADCEIIKRMTRYSTLNANSRFILKSVDKLSCKGYRTLLIAYKIINEEEYIKWNTDLKSCEMNLMKKAKLVDKCYDKIEQELELIGATIVEDKLQDKVPETIKDLRMAGIKIWVLTGDKVDTAENIGLSCNLISSNQKLFKIYNNNSRTTENNLSYEVTKFFNEYHKFERINKRNYIYSNTINFNKIKNPLTNNILNSNNIIQKNINNINNINNIEASSLSFIQNASLINNNNNNNNENQFLNVNNQNNNNISSSKNSSQIIYSKIKLTSSIASHSDNYLPPFSIIIESSILSIILSSEKKKNLFLTIALKASTVICCRVSPLQKSKVVKEVKKYDKKAITLAIGDGGNDVSMIMEAHIGIGIFGEEGMRAVQASDFSIGEFKFLRRLLFFHGRNNLNRISKMILYFFYKNFVFSVVQFVYGFFCMGSGQTIIDDWFITFYNLVFTAFPLGVQAVTDFDVLESDLDIISKFMPFLYIESRDIYPVFNLFIFVISLGKGFAFSFLIFYIVCFCDLGSEINKQGDYGTLWYMSFKTYTCIVISVNMTLFLNVRYITFLMPLIMFITSFAFYIIFLIIVNHMTMFNSFAVIFHSLACPKIYFSISLVCSMSFLCDYLIDSININFFPNLSVHLLRKIINKENDNIFMNKYNENRKMYSNIFHTNQIQNQSLSKLSFISGEYSYKDIEFNGENIILKKARSSQFRIDNGNLNEIVYRDELSKMHSFTRFNLIKNNIITFDNQKGSLFKPNDK